MLNILFYILIIIISVIFMEIVAILSHKYIMHGPGWVLHKSHHIKARNQKDFELNDLYFIFFSSPSIFCIIYGFLYSDYLFLAIGIGILMYGVIYVVLHDIMVHGRFGLKLSLNINYLKKIRKSHMKHHSCKEKNGATNFGFITYK